MINKTINDLTPEELNKSFLSCIRKYFFKIKDRYFERAAEDIGVWVRDYYAPDGRALADLSYWENEDEIYEKSIEYYIEDLKSEELEPDVICGILEYFDTHMGWRHHDIDPDELYDRFEKYLNNIPEDILRANI
jgi:hypothetical protein